MFQNYQLFPQSQPVINKLVSLVQVFVAEVSFYDGTEMQFPPTNVLDKFKIYNDSFILFNLYFIRRINWEQFFIYNDELSDS